MAAKALSALAGQRLLRAGIGFGGAVVTERALATVTGNDQDMYNYIIGTTAGGVAWGAIGSELALGGIAGLMIGLSTQAVYFLVTDKMKQ